MLFYNYTKDKIQEKEREGMLNDEICKLRDELNNSIVNGNDYAVTYQISVELDELIAQYYREYMQKDKQKEKKTTVLQ